MRPVNKRPIPINSKPVSRAFFFFFISKSIKPTNSKIGAIFDGLKKDKILPSKLASLSICAVTVVPIFAPIIIGIEFFNFKIPALTNPTTITVVAVELCNATVIKIPVNTPLKTLSVARCKIFSNFSPAIFFKLELNKFIP